MRVCPAPSSQFPAAQKVALCVFGPGDRGQAAAHNRIPTPRSRTQPGLDHTGPACLQRVQLNKYQSESRVLLLPQRGP
ncbi:hypothetical protein DPEC_G00124780 [Dallia pectoralis]|uniref:Uncharacterized protein n=1 Tax=Dallia pectoralis TaxID=75939 RepID=A0ACC2GQS8_DALPE|nr:hypothetical protein DPEC_G00124780 [Dallia pectoralis]